MGFFWNVNMIWKIIPWSKNQVRRKPYQPVPTVRSRYGASGWLVPHFLFACFCVKILSVNGINHVLYNWVLCIYWSEHSVNLAECQIAKLPPSSSTADYYHLEKARRSNFLKIPIIIIETRPWHAHPLISKNKSADGYKPELWKAAVLFGVY